VCFQGQTFSTPSNENQLRIYNNFDCNVSISGSLVGNFSIEQLDVLHINYNTTVFNETDVLSIDLLPSCELKSNTLKQQVFIENGTVIIELLWFYQPAFGILAIEQPTVKIMYTYLILGFVIFVNV